MSNASTGRQRDRLAPAPSQCAGSKPGASNRKASLSSSGVSEKTRSMSASRNAGGDAAGMPKDGSESEQRTATQSLARFGSLHDVPALGLRERCGRRAVASACRYIGGAQCNRRFRVAFRLKSNTPKTSRGHGIVHFAYFLNTSVRYSGAIETACAAIRSQ